MAAEALMAFRDGDKGEHGMVGALLTAEDYDHQRVVAEFCLAFAGTRKKR